MKCPIVIRILGYGYSEGFFSRLGRESPGEKGGTGGCVNIKATKGNETAEKILAVTVTNVDEAPTGVSITGGGKIGVNRRVTRCRNINRGNMKCPIVIRILGYGYSEGFFSRLGRESPGEKGGTGGFDIL
jgi:hypothetical protein